VCVALCPKERLVARGINCRKTERKEGGEYGIDKRKLSKKERNKDKLETVVHRTLIPLRIIAEGKTYSNAWNISR